MPALTEEQKKKIRELKPKATAIKPENYVKGSPGPAAKRIQAGQPNIPKIGLKAGSTLAEPITRPLVSAAKSGVGLLQKGAGAARGARIKQKQSLSMRGQGIDPKDISTMSPEERAINALQGEPSPQSTIPVQPPTTSTPGQPPTTSTPGQPPTTSTPGQPSASDTGQEQSVSTGTPGQPGYGKITATRGARMSPAEQRFRAPVARPATRADRGLTPVGRNNSGQGYGARRRPEGEREIAPPTSAGDRLRYRREIRERDKNREFSTQQAGTDIQEQEAVTRTDLASQKLTSEQEQRGYEQEDRVKLQSLQSEFADPQTSSERKRSIEREIGIMSGRPIPQETRGKSLDMTEKQRVDTSIKLRKEYDELAKKEGGFLGFGGSKPTYSDWLSERHPDLAEQFGGTTPSQSGMTKESFNKLESGDTYVGSDGKTYRKP